MSNLHTITALFAGLLVVTAAPAADPLDATATAKLILDRGWAKTKAARDFVNQQNLDAPPLKDNSFVRASHWLVLMYQDQNDLALDSLKVFIDKHPTSMDPLHAEAWIRMKDKDYGKALLAAQKLGELIAPSQLGEKTPAPVPAKDDMVVFLGHVAGFLEGPANKANNSERQKFEAELLLRLTDSQKEKFRSAKDEVLNQYRRLREQAGEFSQQAKQDIDAAKQGKLSQLDEQSQKLQNEKAKADADAQKAREDFQRKMADLERQDAPLQSEWRRLKSDVDRLSNQIQDARGDIRRLEREAADRDNKRPPSAREIASARDRLSDLNSRLGSTNRRVFEVEAAHQRLVEQGLQSQWQAQIQGQQLQGQQMQLDQNMRKTANDKRRAEDGKGVVDADARALARKATQLNNESVAFSTYDRFPFEDLKAKLMKAIK